MMFRIQKLLMCEYSDFEETVLVESPFAQVSEAGKGIRQVQIALTPTKLVIAVDSFNKTSTHNLSNVYYWKQDPETECMELVSLIPLDFLYIKIFRKGQRQLMKVAVGGFKIMLFEFGGHLFKNLYWNVWRDRISSLRTFQNRFFAHIVPTTESSSSDTGIRGQPLEVVVEVHNYQSEESSDIVKLHENTTFISTSKDTLGLMNDFSKCDLKDLTKSKDSGSFTSPITERPGNALREVAQYFLDTQSEIILRGSDKDICDGSCMNAQLKSASFGNVYTCMGVGW